MHNFAPTMGSAPPPLPPLIPPNAAPPVLPWLGAEQGAPGPIFTFMGVLYDLDAGRMRVAHLRHLLAGCSTVGWCGDRGIHLAAAPADPATGRPVH
mgnify:CR=1 FL=1